MEMTEKESSLNQISKRRFAFQTTITSVKTSPGVRQEKLHKEYQ